MLASYLITHTDMDGIGAAAVYLAALRPPDFKLFFVEPYQLDYALRKINFEECESVAIMDLGVNPPIFPKVVELVSSLTSKKILVRWFDHHIWETSWMRQVEEIGVELIHDTSTCATGVVYNYAVNKMGFKDYEFLEFVRGVCAGDLWSFDHWLGGFYLRLVRRRDSDSWRDFVINKILQHEFVNESFIEKVEMSVNSELRVLSGELLLSLRSLRNGYRVAAVGGNEEVDTSFIASYVLGRYDVDMVVVVSPEGKLSLRSRSVNVRDLAVAMGGGGHPKAAGAKIEIPVSLRIVSLLDKKALLNYVLDQIDKHSDLIKPIR